jgi:hypothetical protein
MMQPGLAAIWLRKQEIGNRYEQIRKIVQSSRFLAQNDCPGSDLFDRCLVTSFGVDDITRLSLFAQVLYPGRMSLPSRRLRSPDSR